MYLHTLCVGMLCMGACGWVRFCVYICRACYMCELCMVLFVLAHIYITSVIAQ